MAIWISPIALGQRIRAPKCSHLLPSCKHHLQQDRHRRTFTIRHLLPERKHHTPSFDDATQSHEFLEWSPLRGSEKAMRQKAPKSSNAPWQAHSNHNTLSPRPQYLGELLPTRIPGLRSSKRKVYAPNARIWSGCKSRISKGKHKSAGAVRRKLVISTSQPRMSDTRGRNAFRILRFRVVVQRPAQVFSVACDRAIEPSKKNRIDKWLLASTSVHQMRQRWGKLSRRQRSLCWPRLVIHCFGKRSISELFMVLMGTFEQGHASSMQLSIAVDFLIQRYLHFGAATTKYTSSRVSTLLDVMEPLQRLAGPGQLQLSQRSIYLLSHALPSISACNSFLNLAQQQKILLPRTVSLAAYNLGRIGWVGEALSLVQLLEPGSIKKAGKHSGFLGLWTTLLKMVPQAKGARATELAILRTMWDTASIKPNFGHHTVLIENALKRDEYETAWLLLDSLDKSASNAALLKIYSILLNAAKHKLDIARVKAIAERVHELNTPNAYIINDILHGILVINRRPHEAYEKGLLLDTRSPFLQMLPIFERHFYRPSLRRLTAGLWAYPLEEKTLTSTDALAEQRLVPTVHTLTIMIEALLHGARNLHVSRKFYSQFKSLLAENDPAALSIGSSVQFYNSLLKNFAQFDGSLKDCTAILGDMLAAQNSNTSLENTTKQKPSTSLSDSFDPNISWNANSNVKKTTSWRCPKPSVHTYTIVMAKYMKVKCPRSAENVLTLMHNHSVKPSLVTWLHLIDGYVKLQDPVMAANAYQRMRAAGISPDATITHILATLRDRETYLATLERLEKEKLPL